MAKGTNPAAKATLELPLNDERLPDDPRRMYAGALRTEVQIERRRELSRNRYVNNPDYRARKLKRDRERYANDEEYRERILKRTRERKRSLYANNPEYRKQKSAKERKRKSERILAGKCPSHSYALIIAGTHHCRLCSWMAHCKSAKRRKWQNALTQEMYYWLLEQPCIYCGRPATGVDRVKNEYGYTSLNSVPCCRSCNFLKGSRDMREMLESITLIAARHQNYEVFKCAWILHREAFQCQFTNGSAASAEQKKSAS